MAVDRLNALQAGMGIIGMSAGGSLDNAAWVDGMLRAAAMRLIGRIGLVAWLDCSYGGELLIDGQNAGLLAGSWWICS